MKITLRKRATGVEKTALYLDILHNGKRSRESLIIFGETISKLYSSSIIFNEKLIKKS